jgi:negative regulator of replication initiation
LIIKDNQTDEEFLSNIQSQLKNISESAQQIYSQFIDETPVNV